MITIGRETAQPRTRLDVDVIVEAALALVRAEGIDAVTMRSVAANLGTGPMSLYRHVADREALLVGMLDRVAEDLALPPRSADPRNELTGILTAAHALFRADPWIVPLITVHGLAGTGILPAVERMIYALEQARFDDAAIASGYALLWQFTYGEVMAFGHHRPDSAARMLARTADATRFPTLAGLVRRTENGEAHDYFNENLERVLDGLFGQSLTRPDPP